MINTRNRPPFTASQWQELEHQALIFKYMVAGVPVPPDLVLPLRRSFDSISASLLHQPTVGWSCLQMGFGRKADPEPGRCRRTDGKKWRCSKDAFPDSKYCERHMHRGRNRSRKHVEANPSPTTQATSSSSSSSKSLLAANHQGVPFLPLHGSRSSSSTAFNIGFSPQSTGIPLQLDSGSYSSSEKDYRYFHALKEDVDEQSFLSRGSGSSRSAEATSQENQWSLMPLKLGIHDQKKEANDSVLQNEFSQFVTIEDLSRQQPQHCFLGNDFMAQQSRNVREDQRAQEVQPLRCFFDDWPKDRDSWSGFSEDQSNDKSFSTTQLSISIPMASSDFSSTNT
ncbi:unnamed protein product [Victoria cruziana]